MFLTGGGGNLNQFIEKSSVFERKKKKESERGGEIVVVCLSQWPIGKEDYTQKQIPVFSPLGEDNTPMTKSNEHMIKSQVLERVSKSLVAQTID